MGVRIIPRLDIKGPNLVKGIHLEGLRVLGKPEDFAQYYYENGADELIYMDVVASLYQRNSLLGMVSKASKDIFIPLTVGGGLRSIQDIRDILRAGADKVALNTAAIQNPRLIEEASHQFGSSTIVVAIDAVRKLDGSYEACVNYGRDGSGVDPFEWAIHAERLGAGELMVTAINQEGTERGYDLDLTKQISESVNIPVIACGGAGKLSHVYDVIKQGKADAVSLATMLHYDCFLKLERSGVDYENEGNTVFLKIQRDLPVSSGIELKDIKQYLSDRNIECRPPDGEFGND